MLRPPLQGDPQTPGWPWPVLRSLLSCVQGGPCRSHGSVVVGVQDISLVNRLNAGAPGRYELCNQHGIYLMDEANCETHGFDPALHNNAVVPRQQPPVDARLPGPGHQHVRARQEPPQHQSCGAWATRAATALHIWPWQVRWLRGAGGPEWLMWCLWAGLCLDRKQTESKSLGHTLHSRRLTSLLLLGSGSKGFWVV